MRNYFRRGFYVFCGGVLCGVLSALTGELFDKPAFGPGVLVGALVYAIAVKTEPRRYQWKCLAPGCRFKVSSNNPENAKSAIKRHFENNHERVELL